MLTSGPNHWKCSIALLCLLSCLSIPRTAAAEVKRVALVIGNSKYKIAPLKNPSNDADAVSLALKGLGFDVTVAKDLSKFQLEKAVDDITKNLDEDDACLISYAGHGQGFENENDLIPVDAVLEGVHHIKERCVSVSYLLSALRYSDCSMKIVVVDACRNNPFRSFHRSSPGLQSSTRAPEGTIVSFSTSPQTPALDGDGDNSPFAKHLAGAMRTRADQVEIVRLFREVSQAVKQETGHPPYLDFDASMPDYFLKRRRDLVPDPPTVVTNSIGMQLRLIPAGEFLMGSPESEEVRDDDEHQHRVRITKPFYMQTTEVTQGQWKAVMATEPWAGKDYVKEGADSPATFINHDDAVEFCRKLSSRDRETYRLPTEAEWEYACRGGTETMYSFGVDADELGQHAWSDSNADDVGEEYAHAVGQKRPNPFGLFDMHGNVWEWCSDWYDEDYYQTAPLNGPVGPSGGSYRVYRGGGRDVPAGRVSFLGFRVLREVKAAGVE